MTARIGSETWLFEGDIKRRRGESKTEWNRLEYQRKRIERYLLDRIFSLIERNINGKIDQIEFFLHK